MSKFNAETNPRFVLVSPSIREQYPDVPDNLINDELILWDRQEGKRVATIHSDYAQAVCLETTHGANTMPFTNMMDWFNLCSNKALASENIAPTK